MTPEPYKTCPQCGQPAVVQMPQCRRCGYVFPPAPSAAPYGRPMSAASWRELAGPAPVAAPTRGQRWSVLAALVLLGLVGLVGAGAFVYGLKHPGGRPVAGAALPAQSGGMADPTAGPFVERPGRTEMPTLRVTNGEDEGTLFLVLQDANGRTWRTAARPGETSTLQVPPGDYRLRVSSDERWLHANDGDATFRRFKEYSATFVASVLPGRIHIGD